jgi:hypothetical protein
MVYKVNANKEFSGNWSYSFSSQNLDAVNVPNVFTIT